MRIQQNLDPDLTIKLDLYLVQRADEHRIWIQQEIGLGFINKQYPDKKIKSKINPKNNTVFRRILDPYHINNYCIHEGQDSLA